MFGNSGSRLEIRGGMRDSPYAEMRLARELNGMDRMHIGILINWPFQKGVEYFLTSRLKDFFRRCRFQLVMGVGVYF
jgi:hypothetical protein